MACRHDRQAKPECLEKNNNNVLFALLHRGAGITKEAPTAYILMGKHGFPYSDNDLFQSLCLVSVYV